MLVLDNPASPENAHVQQFGRLVSLCTIGQFCLPQAMHTPLIRIACRPSREQNQGQPAGALCQESSLPISAAHHDRPMRPFANAKVL